MHASRLFKCFFFFSFFFFRATGLRNSALGKILIDQQCLSSFFNTRRSQDYEALDIHEPRVTNDSSFRVIGFFSFFSYETYLVKYSSSALRILYQASTYQCESCPEVWTLMHRHYFVSLYIPLISFIRENFWQSYELNDFFFFERLDVEG